MGETILETLRIGELNEKKKRFFIPDYQRGYRWTDTEVKALLDDVLEFGGKRRSSGWQDSWYCLQPIVARKLHPERARFLGLADGDDWYEVIDGQQRITTIFLITRYINVKWRGEEKKAEPLIEYQTRKETGVFLRNLGLGPSSAEKAQDDIDQFHMWKAFERITSWALGLRCGDPTRNEDSFMSTFFHYTRAIWYEVEGGDPVDVFTRLNMYKIPLTNAELVKALLLNQDNFAVAADGVRSIKEEERIHLRQVEIANEWDSMEAGLRDDSFWCFLVDPDTTSYETRIELILDLIAGKGADSDRFHTFRHFRNLLAQDRSTAISKIWQSIKGRFMALDGWFRDRLLYHRIGYLIATGTKLSELVGLEARCESKSELRTEIDKLVADTLYGIVVEDLVYGSQGLRTVLLLHNVETTLRSDDDTARFPFDRFKKEDWDIEHVHALADGAPREYAEIKAWCLETLPYVDSAQVDLKARICEIGNEEKPDRDHFAKVYSEVLSLFGDQDEGENEIANLVLLDSRTNRSYKAAIFPRKRREIIEKVKDGGFVPICTRNVFLKFYSNEVTHLHFWGKPDRAAYLKDIREVLLSILPSVPAQRSQP